MAARDTTFCFTDIAGSTDILRRLGEARYDELLERHRQLIRTALADAGGTEVKTEGDGFFVTFDDAAAALRFAFEAQRSLADERWPVPVRVRMGLHRGPAQARADGDYSALAAHQAARVAAAAHGGQVLCTGDVVRDCDPPAGARLVHLGEHRLRDFDGGVMILQLSIGGADSFPPLRAPRASHGLPLPRSSMVGREAELQLLREVLVNHPIVTLHGPGGVGKTRLALEAAAATAAAFPDGLHLVELSAVTGSDVISTVASALQVRAIPGQELSDLIVRALATGQRLVVLDSAEQVLEPVALLAQAIAEAGSGCTLLVTTTEPLRVPDERVVPIAPLPLPAEDDPSSDPLGSDAVRLLLQRARGFGADLGDGASVGDRLAAIARRLDGVPLALELAAGRIADLGIDETLEGLDDRFSLLTNGWRTALPRHRTLEAMVTWTVSLLEPADRTLLERLATLRGRWRAPAAVSVCVDAGPGAIGAGLEALARLADRSLVSVEEGDLARVQMFDTIRAFAERSLSDDDRRALLDRKRSWLTVELRRLSDGSDLHLRREIDHLLPDVREAAAPPVPTTEERVDHATELAALAAPWYEARGLWPESIPMLQAILEVAPQGRPRADATAQLAHHLALGGDLAAASELSAAVLRDPAASPTARALSLLVATPPMATAPEDSDPLAEALELAGPTTSSLVLAVRSRMGVRAIAHGDAATAVELLRGVVTIAREHGRLVVWAQAVGNLGGALLRLGRLDDAEAALQEARGIAAEQGLRQVHAACLTNLSVIALSRGDPARARELAEARIEISREMGDLLGEATAHVAIANAALALGDQPTARDRNRLAYETFRKIGLIEGQVTALLNLAILADTDGNGREAREAVAELVAAARQGANPVLHSMALHAAAGVAAGAGRSLGATLLGAADRHRPPTNVLDAADVAWLERAEEHLRGAIGVNAFDSERARGRELDIEAALTLAGLVVDDDDDDRASAAP